MGFLSESEYASQSSKPLSELTTPLNHHPPPSMDATSGAVAPKSYWRFSKNDFFPEPSFRDFSTYLSALSETPHRLKNRVFGRSSDENELIEGKKQSENEMKKCLTWWDLIWLGFGSVVGSGIFTITGLELHNHAGPAIVISYAISGFSALLSVLCYTEFSVEIPVAGGSFSFLRIELGDFIAFIAAGNLMLEALVGSAGLGRSWSSYFTSIFTDNPYFLRFKISSFAQGFNLLDPLAVLILLFANGIAVMGTKTTSILNWISSIFGITIIIFIIITGFIRGNTKNLVPFFPYGAKGVFNAASVVYWSYTGFDMVATLAEEVKTPSKDIPIGLTGSMSLITIIYCLMSLALAFMVKYSQVDVNAPFSIAFDVIGMKWAKYLVSIVALKGMTTSLLVGSMGVSRYTTQIARAHMIPPYFALVHPKTGTPVYATLFITSFSCVIALFTSLDVLSSVFSFSTLFIFMLMAVALLVRRYYVTEVTSKGDLIKFLLCLFVVFGSSLGITIMWRCTNYDWIGYSICGGVFFMGSLGMALCTKQRAPKVWGVPLVPWLPCLSIGVNIFLLGSLGSVAMLRFVVCTGVMVVYYLLVGVHSTYDMAHKDKEEVKV